MTEQAVKFMREELDRVDNRINQMRDEQSTVLAKISEFIRFAEQDRQDYMAKIEAIYVDIQSRTEECVMHKHKIESLAGNILWLWVLISGLVLSVTGSSIAFLMRR